MLLVVRLRRHLNRRRRRRLGPCPWLLLLQQLLALQRRSRTVCRARQDGLARARVANRRRILRVEDRVAHREPLARRQLLSLTQLGVDTSILHLLGRLAARVEAVAHRRAAREKAHERRAPLLAAAAADPRLMGGSGDTTCRIFDML